MSEKLYTQEELNKKIEEVKTEIKTKQKQEKEKKIINEDKGVVIKFSVILGLFGLLYVASGFIYGLLYIGVAILQLLTLFQKKYPLFEKIIIYSFDVILFVMCGSFLLFS